MRWCKFLVLIILLVVPKVGFPGIIVEISDTLPPDVFRSQGVVPPAGNIPAQSFYLDKEYRIESLEGWFQYRDTPNATAILYRNDTDTNPGKNLPGSQIFASDPFTLPTVTGTDLGKGFFGVSGLDLALDPGIYWLGFTSTSPEGVPGKPTLMMPFLPSTYPFNGAIFYSSLGNWISPGETHFGIRVQGTPVPEPSMMLLLGSGLVGLIGYGRKRLKK